MPEDFPAPAGPPGRFPSAGNLRPAPRRYLLHLLLFLATGVTTILAGALQQGVNPLTHPWELYRGIPFSFALLLILGSHEAAHYLVSRRHQLEVSLPYFLPAPPIPFIVGTFGAFIRIRSPIRDKRALLDVGCSGPLTGVAVSLPVLYIGLTLSHVQIYPMGAPTGLVLGEPLFFKLVNWLVFGSLSEEHVVVMHPVAFAGWIGLLVTALNLLPVGQLDGGHVAYALFPAYHRHISWACLGVLVIIGVAAWHGWLLWAGLLALLGFRHPPPADDWLPLDRPRRLVGALTIAVFILSFSPMPFTLG